MADFSLDGRGLSSDATAQGTDAGSVGTDDPRVIEFIDRRGALILLAFGGIPLVQACSITTASSTIRYRMTVEVNTPEGVRSGSSVMEVTVEQDAAINGKGDLHQYYNGEAVAVDLPSGATLFALLVDKPTMYDYPAYLLQRALVNGKASPPLSRRYGVGEWRAEAAEARQVKPTILLAPAEYPLLVRFGDIQNPKSVEAVDPNDLARSFGAGISLKRIFITITDEQIDQKIVDRLSWIDDSKKDYSIYGDFRPTPRPTLAQLLYVRDFRRKSNR